MTHAFLVRLSPSIWRARTTTAAAPRRDTDARDRMLWRVSGPDQERPRRVFHHTPPSCASTPTDPAEVAVARLRTALLRRDRWLLVQHFSEDHIQ